MPDAAAVRSVRWSGTASVRRLSAPKIGGWYATTTAVSVASASSSTAGVRLAGRQPRVSAAVKHTLDCEENVRGGGPGDRRLCASAGDQHRA
jgi:hypothetical protein